MEAAKRDITIRTGDSFTLAFRLYTRDPTTGVRTYMNLTGYTGRAVMREHEDSDTVLATFTVAIADQVATPGLVRVTLTPTQTTALALTDGVWGVRLTSPDGTESRTWVAGAVDVRKGVAR